MILKVHFITAKHLVATSKDSSLSLSWKVGKVGWRVNSWEARVEEQHWAGRLASAILMLFLFILLVNHIFFTVLGRLLHKQLVNVEEEGGFEMAGLSQKSQPRLSGKGQLFIISFIPGDKRIPKGVGTLSKTLALVPRENGSQSVAIVGEVDI